MHLAHACYTRTGGYLNLYKGVCGQVVSVIDLESLAPHHCGFESCQGLDFSM